MPATLALVVLLAQGAAPPAPTVPFEAPRFGVKTAIPKDWPLAVREQDDLFLYISAALAGSEAEITVNRGGTPRVSRVRNG